MWQAFRQDLRYALRRLAQQPAFSLAVVLILAAGISATSAVFSIVHGVLLRPLPFAAADRLVVLNETARGFWGSVSAPNFLDWKDQNRTFASMGAYRNGGLNLTGKFVPQRLESAEVSSGFFESLGVDALRGRLFTSGEYLPGAPNVAVISSGLWNSVFGAEPGRSCFLSARHCSPGTYSGHGLLPACVARRACGPDGGFALRVRVGREKFEIGGGKS